MPFQSNTYFSSGPLEKTGNVVIIQPIVPIKLTRDWNLITRWVTRVVYVPRASSDHGSAFGLGNLQPEFYFAPAHTGKVIGGVGPKRLSCIEPCDKRPVWVISSSTSRRGPPNLMLGNTIICKHAPNVPQCALHSRSCFSTPARRQETWTQRIRNQRAVSEYRRR